jgi:putative DNA primase/helicase
VGGRHAGDVVTAVIPEDLWEGEDFFAGQQDPTDLLPAAAVLAQALASQNEPERTTHARSLIPTLQDLGPAELQEYRDAIVDNTKVTKRDFDAILTHERKQRVARERSAEAQRRAAAVAVARSSRNCLPPPSDPMKVARSVLDNIEHSSGVPHVAWWRGDWYRWSGSHWIVWPDSAVDEYLYAATENATFVLNDKVERWSPTKDKVANLGHALGRGIVQRDPDLDADKVISCTNGVIDLSLGRLLAHTPKRFNLYTLPYAYDPDATCPQWLEFLESVLPGQEDGRQFLKEWFGYVISGRTDLQKMASLVGPPRCGKGTIARVMEALLGSESVASPTMEKMATQFGEQGLIGKTLAILADVRWNARAVGEAVPVLLAISGEDARDVPRKNRVDWHGKLDARFVLMSNDTPTFTDASGALAVRMIHIVFTESFLGREDPTLTERLLGELPGILNWAIEGLKSLQARGHFAQPKSGVELHEEVLRLSSPVTGFVEDRCELVTDAEEELDGLYEQFEGWSKKAGYNSIPLKEIFSRNLQSAFRGKVRVVRRTEDKVRKRFVIGLKCEHQPVWLGRS